MINRVETFLLDFQSRKKIWSIHPCAILFISCAGSQEPMGEGRVHPGQFARPSQEISMIVITVRKYILVLMPLVLCVMSAPERVDVLCEWIIDVLFNKKKKKSAKRCFCSVFIKTLMKYGLPVFVYFEYGSVYLNKFVCEAFNYVVASVWLVNTFVQKNGFIHRIRESASWRHKKK